MRSLLSIINRDNHDELSISLCGGKNKDISLNAEERIKMIRAFVDRTFTEDLDRAYLSELFGVNSDTLSRHFSRYTGIPLYDYINKKRIDLSKKMLSETDYTVTKISIICGFYSIRTFNRRFRKETSMSPGDFRRNCLTDNTDHR